MPIKPTPPGVDLKPSELKPVTVMNVKSLIAGPLDGARLKPGRITARGVAWTGGEATVTRVEVSTGQGGWNDAVLDGPAQPYAWRRWRSEIDASHPGTLVVRARATDSNGDVQPEVSPWNKSGYLWNGYDQVTCEVR